MKRRASLGLVAVTVMTLLAACASGPGSGSSGRGQQPTATPARSAALAWRRVTLPQGVQLSSAGFAASPVDGRNAWICAAQTVRSFGIWATRDAGNTWKRAATLSPATPLNPGMCELVPDQDDALALAAVFTWGSGEAGDLDSMTYFSSDDGGHWRRVPGNLRVEEVASAAGKTYALLASDAFHPAQRAPGLVVSADDLQSWQFIHPAGLSPTAIARFWLTPPTGQLLAGAFDGTLWLAEGAGPHWSRGRMLGIDMQTALGAWLAQGHWLICGWPDGEADQLRCSANLGATWQSQPVFDYTIHCEDCGKGAPPTTTYPCVPSAIAPDGALLAICPPTDVKAGQRVFLTYRLRPGAPAWDSLGAAPGSVMVASADGYLWCLAMPADSESSGSVSVVALPT